MSPLAIVEPLAVAVLLVACGPRVGGEEHGSGDGTAEDGSSSTTTTSTTTSTTTDASSSEDTGEPGCEREPVLQWWVDDEDSDAFRTAGAATPAGAVALATTQRVFDTKDNHTDARVELWNAAGALAWSDAYAGANELDDWGLDVAVDAQGDIYVLVSETLSMSGKGKAVFHDRRLVVLRYDSAGSRVWRWERERPPAKGPASYHADGQIEVMGDRVIILEHAFDEATMLFELDLAGNFISEVTLAIDDDGSVVARDLAENGDVAFSGYAQDLSEIWVMRFDRSGALQWSKTFGAYLDRQLALIAGPSGETYVGWGTDMPDATALVYLQRVEDDGAEAWTELLPSTSPYTQDLAGDVADDGTLLLTGRYSVRSDPPDEWQPLWVARYTADGCSAWMLEQDFPEPSHDGQGELVVDAPDGAAFVLATYDGYGGAPVPWLGRIAE